MKKIILVGISIAAFNLSSFSQTLRYFEFKTECGHGNWQDTSFIAATSNEGVIGDLLLELKKPFEERKFINGTISRGHGGHNRNAGHWFKWHFTPGDWELAEMAIEVCDGCPYSDLDADTAYWIGNIGRYCPWSGRPIREIEASGQAQNALENARVFPNPAKNLLNVSLFSYGKANYFIFNLMGIQLLNGYLSDIHTSINIEELNTGLYFLIIDLFSVRKTYLFLVE
ncbi:MAG: T9SS type A sorting domain-containing protein [Bacteroidales bacterium]|nr:T9SS type A sorting domain-containing protein [Bacteroidales bacterium]